MIHNVCFCCLLSFQIKPKAFVENALLIFVKALQSLGLDRLSINTPKPPKGGAERTTGRSFRRVRCLVSRRHAPKDAARTPKSTSVAPVERACSQHLLTTHSQAADLGNQETHSFTLPKTNLRKGYRAEQYHSAVPLASSARTCTPPAS